MAMVTSVTLRWMLVVLAALGGCASTPSPGEPLTWDYERDGQAARREQHARGFFESLGKWNNLGLLGGTPEPLEELTLSPRELNRAILEALAPRQRVATFMSRSPSNLSLAGQPTGRDSASGAHASEASPQGTWSIASSNDGQIVTDWQAVPGREAGVMWWKKRYEAEVRHIVTVRQAMHAANLSSYSIQTEVRERPNPSYAWTSADPELGRADFLKVKAQLWHHIQRQSMAKKAAK